MTCRELMHSCTPCSRTRSSAFKRNTSTYPLYGLRSSPPLQSPDEWWARLIQRTFSSSSLRIPARELEERLPILTSRLLQRFGSKEGYELFPEVEASLEQLKSIDLGSDSRSMEGDNTVRKKGLRLSLATNSDSRILKVLQDFDLDRFLNLSIPDSNSVIPPAAISLPMVSKAIEEYQRSYGRSATSMDSLSPATLSYFEGFEKPHPDFFRIASKRLFPDSDNLDFSTILYVGDQLSEDYLGARRAGLSALWLRRRGEGNRSQPEADDMELDGSIDPAELERDTVENLKEVADRVTSIKSLGEGHL